MSRPIAGSLFHKSKTLNDKYLLGDEIGKGAYGRVYKGVDLQNGDFVAIKQVSLENILTEDLHSIMLEIDLLKNLNHKNIVKYLGSFKTKSHLYIILEYVENGALASIIKPNKFGAFPESLTAVYIAQVLEGLVYLHEQGVIHRDIKGANILTTKEGLVKLADFGVATKLTEADADTRSVVGTPYWMAPEVIEMSGVTASSDIWSVGCTVIELMTCSPPYYDLQPMPALFRIVQDERPPFPDGLSALLVDFLTQCFQKDPKLRPDAKQLLKHPWIRNSRRQMQSSWKNTAGKISSISQDVAAVVVRSIEQDDEATSAREDATSAAPAAPLDLENGPIVRDPFESEESDEERAPHSPTMSSPSTSAAAVEKNKPIRISRDSLQQSLVRGSSANRRRSGDFGRADRPPSEIVGSVFDSPRPIPGESNRGEIEMDGWANRGEEEARSARGLAQDPDDRPSTSGQQQRPTVSPKWGLTRAANRKEEREIAAVIEGRRLSQEADVEDDPARQVDEIEGLGGKLEGRENYPKQVAEMTKLLGVLKPDRKEDTILQAADRLCILFREYPEQKAQLIGQFGVTPVMEMLEVSSTQAIYAVLYVLNQLIEKNSEYLEQLCLVGAIPQVLRFASAERPRLIRLQAALFLKEVTHAGGVTLQMLVACGGLPVLVAFLEGDYNDNKEIVFMAIDGMCKVFELKSPTPKNDFCRLFAKSGALDRLISALASTNDEAQRVKTLMPLSPYERASTHARNLSNESPLKRPENYEHSRSGLGRLEGAENDRGGGFPSPSGSAASRAPLLGPVHSTTSSASSAGHHRSTSSFGKGGRGSGGSAVAERGFGVSQTPAEAWEAAEVARGYVAKLAKLVLVFSHADSLVKGFLCSLQLLHKLLKMMERLEQPILVKMLRCIKNLSEDANTLEPLQRAGAIPCLVPILARKEGPLVADMHNQVLSALYNLCKINKTRQEQAAVAGIIPPLLALIREGSPLRQYALPLVCDMAHASRRTRAELWKNKGLEFYLELLQDEDWQVAALDSLAMWLAHDHEQRKVEPALLEKANVQKLVDFFGVASGPTFRNILEPFLKIVTKSPKLNTALALSGLTGLLVSRLEHGDAVAKLTLLKIIKAVYEHHPRPKQFTVEHDLPRKLQRLVEGERDGEMVLVKQMASSLLKALHINSVL